MSKGVETDTGHEGHDVWRLIIEPGAGWCRTCQAHFKIARSPMRAEETAR